ncbi:hypothetical protein HYS54_02115 [Candidatus Micrarchaeota archaeon]|nr:hypothetical protein [Candidatus Micrarchaeota archaeon]
MAEEEQAAEGAAQNYELLKAEEYKYGNNFIEIARKKVGDAEFISISKGFYNKAGQKRYKNGLGFPDAGEIKSFFVETIQKI